MRQEINELDMEQVAGGRYYINGITNRVAWDAIDGVYTLKGCSVYQAMEVMDGLRGTCETQDLYDHACFEALKDRGWI